VAGKMKKKMKIGVFFCKNCGGQIVHPGIDKCPYCGENPYETPKRLLTPIEKKGWEILFKMNK